MPLALCIEVSKSVKLTDYHVCQPRAKTTQPRVFATYLVDLVGPTWQHKVSQSYSSYDEKYINSSLAKTTKAANLFCELFDH